VGEVKKKEREVREQKQKEMHGNVQFNPAKVKANHKYEYPFLGKDEKYTYAFLL